ncbi:hypothetical protein, variant [Aphanomyces astaci]|uniref:PX domain-containing protein n=1 Tax=Aphanomyces astaci TaxID=112090 RepID=W4H1R1_APHAT|nr:hypothetical protein, variant [Aphanomyces astaci]ETV85078.1 hypothetical protein, variant [Aphanomyces astaci]|eukprot:XP_009825096.1 hypothetical protein, variant [Aphanomyces astaci]
MSENDKDGEKTVADTSIGTTVSPKVPTSSSTAFTIGNTETEPNINGAAGASSSSSSLAEYGATADFMDQPPSHIKLVIPVHEAAREGLTAVSSSSPLPSSSWKFSPNSVLSSPSRSGLLLSDHPATPHNNTTTTDPLTYIAHGLHSWDSSANSGPPSFIRPPTANSPDRQHSTSLQVEIQAVTLPADGGIKEVEDDKGTHIVFALEVRLMSGRQWVIEKRYSDFIDLDDRMQKANAAGVRNLPFPKELLSFRGNTHGELDQCRLDLEKYVQGLLHMQPLKPILTFLAVDAHLASLDGNDRIQQQPKQVDMKNDDLAPDGSQDQSKAARQHLNRSSPSSSKPPAAPSGSDGVAVDAAAMSSETNAMSQATCRRKTSATTSGWGADTFNYTDTTIAKLQDAINSHELSAEDIVQHYLDVIDQLNHNGPQVNGVIETSPTALAIAQDYRNGGLLHGIPVLVKANIATSGDGLTACAGSSAMEGNIAPCDAVLVQKLRAAGAIVLGHANMVEWANWRSLTGKLDWSARGGLTKNPYVLTAPTSGSSSGSALTVAANMIPIAIGTETDGSIVSPASYVSIVGLKPTVGLVSRTGVIPISARQDSPGPMGRTVADVAIVLQAIAGFDPTDPASKDIPVPEYSQTYNALTSFKNVRVAVSKQAHDMTQNEFLSQAQVDAFNRGVDTLKALGADIVYAPYPNAAAIWTSNCEVR